MLETFWIIAFIAVAVLLLAGLSPSFRRASSRGGKAVFYGAALVAIIGGTLAKALLIMARRRMLGA